MNKPRKNVCPFRLIFFLILCNVSSVKNAVYTALSDLEEVVQTESHLVQILEDYTVAKQHKLDSLKRYAAIYRSQHDKSSKDAELYVANPINAFGLVKRLTVDWTEVENLISSDLSLAYITNITNIIKTMKFPTYEDLKGAALALIRLQDTYHLDTSSLARGEINGKKYSSELSANDCFEIGRQSYHNGDHYHTQSWMKQAESRLNQEMYGTVKKSDILEYLAISSYEQGNIPLALDLTNKLLEIVPTHSRALYNKDYYEDVLQNRIEWENEENDGSCSAGNGEIKSFPNPCSVLEVYEQLCRGEISLPVKKLSKLKCRYLTKNNPFLLIAPFKVEEAHHKPDILIFHEVLTDNEIATIKRLAQLRLKRAMVQNSKTGKLSISNYRISKSAWLEENEHKHIASVSQRVGDMTGLVMKTAEELQVMNYGMGGYYEPHFDFARKTEKKHFKTGNRIATVLFYMSDVQQGGATVFPNIHLTLWPQKGAAAFWYNLHPSGDGDKMTLHAACPVLIGSKWVSNKWIHELGQEFLRPCTLERPSQDLMP